jgi:hypothetical protein
VAFDGYIRFQGRGDVLRNVRFEGIEDRSGRIVGDGDLADC